MAQLPGMLGEVFWGKPGAAPLNWREHDLPDDDDDDERPKTDAEKQYLADVLGLTVDELDQDEQTDDEDGAPDISKSFDRLMKSNEEFWRKEGCL